MFVRKKRGELSIMFAVKRGHGRYKKMLEYIKQESAEALKSQTCGKYWYLRNNRKFFCSLSSAGTFGPFALIFVQPIKLLHFYMPNKFGLKLSLSLCS